MTDTEAALIKTKRNDAGWPDEKPTNDSYMGRNRYAEAMSERERIDALSRRIDRQADRLTDIEMNYVRKRPTFRQRLCKWLCD